MSVDNKFMDFFNKNISGEVIRIINLYLYLYKYVYIKFENKI